MRLGSMEGASPPRKVAGTKRFGSHLSQTSFDDGSWELVAELPAELRKDLGDPLWSALCRCFIAVDRLNSFAHLNTLNHENVRPTARVAAARNNSTLFYLSCGTLRELGKALDDMRRAGIKGRLSDAGNSSWDRMTGITKRWTEDKTYTRIRDKMGFHFDDPDLIEAGAASIEATADSLVLAEGSGKKFWQVRFPFGEIVMVRGLWPELRDPRPAHDALAEQIAEDQIDVQVILQEILFDLLTHRASDGSPSNVESDPPVTS